MPSNYTNTSGILVGTPAYVPIEMVGSLNRTNALSLVRLAEDITFERWEAITIPVFNGDNRSSWNFSGYSPLYLASILIALMRLREQQKRIKWDSAQLNFLDCIFNLLHIVDRSHLSNDCTDVPAIFTAPNLFTVDFRWNVYHFQTQRAFLSNAIPQYELPVLIISNKIKNLILIIYLLINWDDLVVPFGWSLVVCLSSKTTIFRAVKVYFDNLSILLFLSKFIDIIL